MLIPKELNSVGSTRRMKGKAMAGNQIDFGEYGLQALEPLDHKPAD